LGQPDPRRYANKQLNGHRFAPAKWVEDECQRYADEHPNPVNARDGKRGGVVKFQPHYPEMAFQLRLLGASNRMIATAMDTTEETVWRWWHGPKFIPEFKEAMERGGTLADARMAEATYHRGLGYSHDEEKILVVDKEVVRVPTIKHYPPDMEAAKFWLTNRQGKTWRNRTTTELTGEDGKPLMPPQLIVQGVDPK
jgi:hypothetical protein